MNVSFQILKSRFCSFYPDFYHFFNVFQLVWLIKNFSWFRFLLWFSSSSLVLFVLSHSQEHYFFFYSCFFLLISMNLLMIFLKKYVMHFCLKIFKVVKVRVIIYHFVVNMKMNMVNKRSNPHISPMIIEMSKLCLKILFICFTFSPIFAVSFFSIF